MMQPLNDPNLLSDARVYLSGPMDFVADRDEEKRFGWRNRVGQFLRELGVTVFDPWIKPELRGVQGYGREDDKDSVARAGWTFEDNPKGAAQRAACAAAFWPALHTDLRMVDTSDFVIAYCPTNLYSVGTPHEIILARQQRKPVLFVSPPVVFPAYDELKKHLEAQNDATGSRLLAELSMQVPVKPNSVAAPSQWYMPLIGGEHFFDGFGFYLYQAHPKFKWAPNAFDQAEQKRGLKKPLLPFLAKLNVTLPQKWDRAKNDYCPNDDWLLWDLRKMDGGKDVAEIHGGSCLLPEETNRSGDREG